MQKFIVGAHTDTGIRKKINQDSVFVEIAETDRGPVLLAAICDGMGGLAKGEAASAMMTEAIGEWFENSLAAAICRDGTVPPFHVFRAQYDFLIRRTGKKIAENSADDSGTTICALLCAGGVYYTANVGDSRIYRLSEGKIAQLTKDQTVVQQKYDAGEISAEEMETHPQRNVLLQCVGATDPVVPEYGKGTYREKDLFLLCSDGFRHKITPEEMKENLLYKSVPSEEQLCGRLALLTELVKERKEKDNISSVAIYAARGSRF